MSSLTKRGDGNLRICYRPSQKDEFYGFNVDAVLKALKRENHSHVFMFTGPSGCGKTSLARYLGLLINCDESDGINPCLKCESCKSGLSGDQQLIRELNMADRTGIDDTRHELKNLRTRMLLPGKKKILILDEAQQLTSAAQQGWLKVLEEPPEWAYIFLCTTEPQKFRADLLNRTTMFQFHQLLRADGIKFLLDIARSEHIEAVNESVASEIYDIVGGSPRELINAAEKVSVEGVQGLSRVGVLDKEKLANLGALISGMMTRKIMPADMITLFYRLLNQFDNVEVMRRAIGKYIEKILRSEASQNDVKSLQQHTKILVCISDPIDPSTPWVLLARLIKSMSKTTVQT